MTRTLPRTLLGLLSLLAAGAVGCASPAKPAEGDAFRRVTPPAGSTPASPAARSASLQASRTLAASAPRTLALATEAGVRERLESRRTLAADGTLTVRKVVLRPTASPATDWAPDAATVQVLAMRVAADGSVALERTTETADAVVTEFSPPLTVLPATLELGQSVTQPLRMIIRPLTDTSKVRTSGDAEQTITYEGDEQLTVPAGEFATRRVRSVLTASLGQARVTSTNITWYADDVGQIAEFREEVVTVLGVRIRHAARTWALMSKAEAEADAVPAGVPAAKP